MGCLMIYLRVRKDRNELEKEQAEKKADILRMSSTREGRNMDNIFLPKPKDKWLIRHNKLNEVVSTDDEDTVRSTLEEVQRYSKRLEKNNFSQ